MVSILIPTTVGGMTHLARLLPNLSREAEETGAEIIVIDNNSKDGTANLLCNYDCTVKFNKVNLGFSKAHNQASKIAQGEYLLLLNNDTAIYPGLLQEMQKVFLLDPKIAVVGCLIMLMDRDKIQHAGVMFTPDYVPYELGLELPNIRPGTYPGIPMSDPRVHMVREVPSVTGACMMIRKDVWEEIGGLDDEYINGWEDVDFCLKARELGYKIYYTGKAKIMHKHFGSPGRFLNEAANRLRYDQIWVDTKRAEKVLGGVING